MSLTTNPRPSTTQSGQRITPFGAIEVDNIEDKIVGKSGVYRIDLLSALRDIWGEWITTKRDALYCLVSGSCSDSELRQYLTYFYMRSAAFNNYVTEAYYFGEQSKPLLVRVIQPARERIQSYYERVVRDVLTSGCQLIGMDRDYVYLVSANGNPPSCEGSEKVC